MMMTTSLRIAQQITESSSFTLWWGASCLYAAVWRETISCRVAFVMKNNFKYCSHGIPEETEKIKWMLPPFQLSFVFYMSSFISDMSRL